MLFVRTPVVSLLFTEVPVCVLTAERCGRTEEAEEPSLGVTTRPDVPRTVFPFRVLV